MRNVLASIILFTLIFLINTEKVLAYNDPASSPNNIIGIHIFNEEDLSDAAELVNSSGGDWGYVTLVITEGERDITRWQKAFDLMRRLHLIPIVRIATKVEGQGWQKPDENQISLWVNFLNSLNWVIQNRYVIIGNEPNHAAEWGGQIDPTGYANYLKDFSSQLRQASGDFYILPAALDASAKNTSNSMDETLFIRKMLQENPKIFDSIDGWASHSYPNPDFSGLETAVGRGTTTTYDWELSLLKTLGVNRNLPVFITETGWSDANISDNEVGRRLSYAIQNSWKDPRIVAVTPFILNYPSPPFTNFSWKNSNGTFKNFYPQIKDLKKNAGSPVQIESGQIIAAFAQPIIPVGSDFGGLILARNTGQSIWNFSDVSIGSNNGQPFIKSYSFNDLEPTMLGLIIFKAASPSYTGIYSSSLYLMGSKNQRITNSFPIEAALLKIDLGSANRFFTSLLGILPLNNK